MTKALRVIQVVPSLEGGGVERGVLEVGQALVERGFTSIVISGGGRLVPSLEAGGSQHFEFPVGKKSLMTLLRVRQYRHLLVNLQPDIVHVRSRLPAWMTYFALRGWPKAQRRPVWLNTVHGLYSVNAYSAIMTRSDHVIAVSETARRYVLENYSDCPSTRVTVIPRGVDPSAFPYGYQADSGFVEAFCVQHQLGQSAPILTLPGRFTRLKGHLAFLHAIAKLKAVWPDVMGLMIGKIDGKSAAYVEELRATIDQLQLHQNVRIIDQVANIRDVYAMSDVVLSLSEKPESFGRTVLEALSLGVPVVGWAHGGVAEILSNVFPAGAVAQGDMDGLIERLKAIIREQQRPPEQHPYTLTHSLSMELNLYERLAESFA